MIRLAVILPVITILLKIFHSKSGFSELYSFQFFKDSSLINGIIVNILISILFAELYREMDSNSNGEDFGFDKEIDPYYFSVVTSSSVGYGDYLPKTNRAKIAVMIHIVSMFFVILPIVMEALKPGN